MKSPVSRRSGTSSSVPPSQRHEIPPPFPHQTHGQFALRYCASVSARSSSQRAAARGTTAAPSIGIAADLNARTCRPCCGAPSWPSASRTPRAAAGSSAKPRHRRPAPWNLTRFRDDPTVVAVVGPPTAEAVKEAAPIYSDKGTVVAGTPSPVSPTSTTCLSCLGCVALRVCPSIPRRAARPRYDARFVRLQAHRSCSGTIPMDVAGARRSPKRYAAGASSSRRTRISPT